MSKQALRASARPEEMRFPWLVRARPYLILLPALLLLIGILYPFLLGVYYSFTAFNFKVPDSQFNFVGLRNYARMVTDGDFLYSTYITLAYAVVSTAIELGLGLLVAMLLNRESRIAKIFTPLLIFPMIIAPVIGTLVWKMMMQPSVGILNPILNRVGLPSLEWAAVPETALFSVALVDIWMFTPFAALMILAGLRSFPNAPFEAARVDGASFWFTFRNLTLPMLTPFILIIVVFRFMDSLKMFDIIFAMTEGGPGNTLMTYQLTAYRTSIQFQRLAGGLPYAILLYIMIYLVSMYLIKAWGRAQRRAAGY
ncbi:MAG: sugar ABC transporter permease [Chloroflexi bacterium]|nr:sugar ABC transporter permease [Chloroflexota bacterium]